MRRMAGCGNVAPEQPARRPDARCTPFLAALALILALGSASGCGAPRAYQPDTTLVATLGHDEAVDRLRALLGRAEAPTVLDVRVTHEHIELVWLDNRDVSRWRFHAIESIDIRSSDHVVTLRLENKRYIYRIDFTTAADATELVDLIASFYRAGSSAEVALPPITRDRERP
jgi:hypothetical protein